MGISLRQHLTELGWDERFLGNDGYYARLGTRDAQTCFVPFGRLRRWLMRRALPIGEIIPPGTKIKFLSSLKHDVVGEQSFLSFSWIMVRVMSLLDGSDLRKMAMFEGFVDGRGNAKQFSQLPFDDNLTVASVRRYDATYQASDGTLWTIDHNALTTVTQIEIEGIPSSNRAVENDALRASLARASHR